MVRCCHCLLCTLVVVAVEVRQQKLLMVLPFVVAVGCGGVDVNGCWCWDNFYFCCCCCNYLDSSFPNFEDVVVAAVVDYYSSEIDDDVVVVEEEQPLVSKD